MARIGLVALVPDDDLTGLGRLEGQGQHLDRGQFLDGQGDVLRQCRDQLRAGQQKRNLQQALGRRAHVDVGICQPSDHLLQRYRVAARPAEQVRQREVLRLADAVLHARVIARDDTNPAHGTQVDDAQGVRKRPQPEQAQAIQTEVEVSVAVLEARQRGFREVLYVDPDAGGLARQPSEHGRHDSQGGVGRYDQREGALHSGRVERGLSSERRLDPEQRLAHGLYQRQAAWRQLHVTTHPHQQLVVEVFPQLLQGSTHRRLRDKDPLGGAGNVLLVEQRVQGDQQVEVEPIELHGG